MYAIRSYAISAITAIILLGKMKLSIPAFFLVIAVANILVAAYIYSVVPEFAMRFLISYNFV